MLFFTYSKQRIPQPTSMNQQSINPKIINTPTVTPIFVGSMFERIKYSGKCNSCSGAK